MSRNVQLVLLCEDQQHATFARRFLVKSGWNTRRLRIELAPPGAGAAEQFVRLRLPKELAAYRSRRKLVSRGLIVVCDGDRRGMASRLRELRQACNDHGLNQIQPDERVAVIVPTWNIETWLAYLSGETVDESKEDYPRLPHERDCQPHVDRLSAMCEQQKLRRPAPPSLEAACTEFRRFVAL